MLLSEFVLGFAENFSVKHISDVDHGVFVECIKDDIYLVKNDDVIG